MYFPPLQLFGFSSLSAARLLRSGSLLLVFALALLVVSRTAQAVSPPPDGDYGNGNTAEGFNALFSLFSGADNTAIGDSALHNNIRGNYDTAVGRDALYSDTAGYNTAVGWGALLSNTTGTGNEAVGLDALRYNNGGTNNVAIGYTALSFNISGSNNTASGSYALYNTTGSNNIAVGFQAGVNLTTGNNNIDIGAQGVAGDASKIRIGKQGTQTATYVAGIYGKSVSSTSGTAVFVDSNGRLGTMKSSARYKEQIKAMDTASEVILKLEPVTFRYKEELDPDGVLQFGLIAEQVEKIDPHLVIRDEEGKVSTVRYEAVNAMVLNEFLKEHRKVQEQEQTLQKQEATIVRQQKDFESKFAQQQKQIEALTAGLQKVSAAVELNKPALTQVADTR